jgi:glycosyltransferase involved in cell wall biosynthesis
MTRVLIAHQSTIPHYRVPFYNMLELLKPDLWNFGVVFDPLELTSPRFMFGNLDISDFLFPVVATNTRFFKVLGNRICYQSFWQDARNYDLVILENAVNNLTYPLCQLHHRKGVKIAYWGHGKDREVGSPRGIKFLLEKIKLELVRRSDGFFAYTPGVKTFLESQGVEAGKIFIVNNTIDILEQRKAQQKWFSKREQIKSDLGISNKKVLLFVGRFTPNKRLDFLLESFLLLRNHDPSFHLLLVGEGDLGFFKNEGVSVFGTIVDIERLAPIYVASDLFTFPGAIGLGALQAMCYDLPVLTIQSNAHKPEIEYLSPRNSIILNSSTTPEIYAKAIREIFYTPQRLYTLSSNIWPSIQHLTIEQMARNFILGVHEILGIDNTAN